MYHIALKVSVSVLYRKKLKVYSTSGMHCYRYVDDHADVVDPSPTPTDPQLRDREAQFKKYFYEVAGEVLDSISFHHDMCMYNPTYTNM